MGTLPVQVKPIELKAQKEPSFWISKQEWFTVQMYVEIGLLLPTEPAEMPFDDIRATYMEIKTHCRTWKELIYPNTVKLAFELSDYSQTAKTYYGALKNLLPDLRSDNPSESAEKKFNLIVEHLNIDAEDYHQRAEVAIASISQIRQHYLWELKKLYQLHAVYNVQSDNSSNTHLALSGIKFLKEILSNALPVIDKIYKLWQLLASDLKALKANILKEAYKKASQAYLNEQLINLDNISRHTEEYKVIV